MNLRANEVSPILLTARQCTIQQGHYQTVSFQGLGPRLTHDGSDSLRQLSQERDIFNP